MVEKNLLVLYKQDCLNRRGIKKYQYINYHYCHQTLPEQYLKEHRHPRLYVDILIKLESSFPMRLDNWENFIYTFGVYLCGLLLCSLEFLGFRTS